MKRQHVTYCESKQTQYKYNYTLSLTSALDGETQPLSPGE